MHENVSSQLFPVVLIFKSMGVICYDRWVLSEVYKDHSKDRCVMNSEPTFYFQPISTQWIMAILSKGWKPDNFESHNSLKLSFTNIWDLHSNFVECESFLESSSPDIDFISFYLRFSWTTHLLMPLSLQTLASIMRTGYPILFELRDLVNSAIIFYLKRPYSDG